MSLRVPDRIIKLAGLTEEELQLMADVFFITKRMFVVTEGFKALVQSLNSGRCLINIKGSKGVGKTMALFALAVLLKESGHPFFLYSAGVQKETLFATYV